MLPNEPLAYAMGKDLHLPILSTLAMHVGQVNRDNHQPWSTGLVAYKNLVNKIVRDLYSQLGL